MCRALKAREWILQKRSHWTASLEPSKSISVSTLQDSTCCFRISYTPSSCNACGPLVFISLHTQTRMSTSGCAGVTEALSHRQFAVAVVDDLLFAFMGLDGKYVRAGKVVQPDGVHISYRLHTQANPALRELSTRMLALW